MKTGGTMNFLKRAGAILMLVAVFASSCNKYADDFKQINTKLDALAQQVAGVTTLSTSLTTLAGQVTALQTAVAGLPTNASITALQTALTTNATAIAAITTTLNTVATAGTATKAVVDGLKTDLTALATKVAADNAALKIQIAAIGTSNDAQTLQLTALVNSNTALALQITALQTSLAGLASGSDATALTIQGLQVMLDAQKLQLDQLLALSNIYNGDVNITTAAEMRTYFKRLSQLAVVNGNVYVNTSGATLVGKLDSVNMITSKITTVVGANVVPHAVKLVTTSSLPKLDFSGLVSVAGNYSITGVSGPGVDVLDDNLTTVGSGVELYYDGPYNFPNLTSIGGMVSSGLNPWVWSGDGTLTIINVPKTSTTVGTTSINFPNVTVSGYVYDGNYNAGVLSYPEATSIALSGGVSSLTAIKATSISLGSINFDLGLGISATKCTTLSLANATTAAGSVVISTAAGCTVDFGSLKSAAGGLSIEGPTTLDKFGKLVSGSLSSTTVETVVLAAHEWAVAANIPAVTSLTLGSLANSLSTNSYPLLETLVVKGKAFSTSSGKFGSTWSLLTSNVTTTASNTVLTSVDLQGNLSSATIQNNGSLASLSTAGVINNLTIDGNGANFVSVSLNHTHYVGGPGSALYVTNNSKLASLSSGVLDYPSVIYVAGNGSLATLDLSSYKTTLLAASGALTSITISGNKLSGNYVNAVAITPTTPYQETKITSAALSSLKTFVGLYPVPTSDVPNPVPALNLACNLDKVTLSGGSSTATLSSRMLNDSGHTTINGASFNFFNPSVGLAKAIEFSLLQ